MGVPTKGLREGDPRQLGGFRLVGRTRESALGVVYLGRDASGAEASVVMLNSAAGGDHEARERFARAVHDRDDVLAARTRGRSALWVALPAGADGAGEVLERTARGGPVAENGPVVQPYWAWERRGSVVRWAPWHGRRDSAVAPGEGSWWMAAALGLVLVLLLLLGAGVIWWMSRFPRPEIPAPGQPVEIEQEESEPAAEPTSGEEGSEEPAPRPDEEQPDIPAPTPEGEGELEGDPEDNL
ncbi:hypothetical protein ACIBFB_09445 [Nocardiopsis sp. NPDC050513]|uniref:hypothetical protein n=1 Tax=Nocardiopsis sp. NPDC050513 TaxID=3364338 RepID=UPI0037AA8382